MDDEAKVQHQVVMEEKKKRLEELKAWRQQRLSTNNNNNNDNNVGSSARQQDIRRRKKKKQTTVNFSDHFTLSLPSSDVTFQGSNIHLFDLRTSQIQMITTYNNNNSSTHQSTPPAEIINSAAKKDIENSDLFLVDDEKGKVSSNDIESSSDDYSADGNINIQVKDVPHDRSANLSALRLVYTVVALFCMATVFVFFFIVILFLFMDVVISVYDYGVGKRLGSLIGTILALPVYLYGFSSILTIGGFFVMEAWNGFPFLKTVTDLGDVAMEWISLTMMLGAPIVTLIITLLIKAEYWWDDTLYVWYSSVGIYFLVFCLTVIFYETQAAWLIVHQLKDHIDDDANGDDDDGGNSTTTESSSRLTFSRFLYFVSQAVQRTQDNEYCGHLEKILLSHARNGPKSKNDDDDDDDDDNSDDGNPLRKSHKVWKRWYTNFTLLKYCSFMFERVDPPERVFLMDDVLINRRFVTKDSWSMEKSLCTSSNSRNIFIMKGPNAVKDSQIISTAFCIILAIGSLLLSVAAFLRWLNVPALPIIVIIVAIVFCCFSRILSLIRIIILYRKFKGKRGEQYDNEKKGRDVNQITSSRAKEEIGETAIYQDFETYRVSRPTRLFRIINILVHYGFFYLYPLITLIMLENHPGLVLFIVVGIWTSIRYWFDPCCILQYKGNFEAIGKSGLYNQWKVQSRMSGVMLNVTRSHGTRVWMATILFFIFGIFVLTIGSLGYETGVHLVSDMEVNPIYSLGEDGYSLYWAPMRLTPPGQFSYPALENLQYPSCSIFSGRDIDWKTSLIDYNFLATVIYQDPVTFQDTTDTWFGPGKAKWETNVTNAYRKTLSNPDTHVLYDVVSYGNRTSVVVIRGSRTAWEWLTDAQYWAPVALMQVFQNFLPLGTAFFPIFDDVLAGMAFVEAKELQEISLSVQTTGLINYLKSSPDFSGRVLSITGQSLGGGMALVTGAETNIPAIAISGPNNKLTRKVFDPALDLETINTMLLNVIPERDIVPRIDKPGLLTQHVACRSRRDQLFDCHMSTRTLCELMYKCGSYNRPPPCECAVKYGYPEPEQVSGFNQTFSDICGTKRSNDGFMTQFDDYILSE